MKLSINKEQIITELQSLAAVADKKQTLPILSNILIRADEEKLPKSTDLEVELEFVITITMKLQERLLSQQKNRRHH